MPNISKIICDTKILLSKNVTETKLCLTFSKITQIAFMVSIIIPFFSFSSLSIDFYENLFFRYPEMIMGNLVQKNPENPDFNYFKMKTGNFFRKRSHLYHHIMLFLSFNVKTFKTSSYCFQWTHRFCKKSKSW